MPRFRTTGTPRLRNRTGRAPKPVDAFGRNAYEAFALPDGWREGLIGADFHEGRTCSVRQRGQARDLTRCQRDTQSARLAFADIFDAAFGGGAVLAEDFADCRNAYEAFALPDGWRA